MEWNNNRCIMCGVFVFSHNKLCDRCAKEEERCELIKNDTDI